MDMTQSRKVRNATIAVSSLALLIPLGWFALREGPTPAAEASAQAVSISSHPSLSSSVLPAEQITQEPVSTPPADATLTNAAVLYRQAFALYDALSDAQKAFIGDPKTNIDASAEAELCEKIRPICDLMQQAVALTNCDWELPRPYAVDMKMPHLAKARQLARTANWSANRCHTGDTTGAVAELVAASRLGHHLASQFGIGCLVDAAIQGLLLETAREHASLWRLAGDADILADPNYGAEFPAAISQEADAISDNADRLSTRPADEAISNLNVFALAFGLGDNTPELQKMGPAQGIAYLRQFGEAVRGYGDALLLSDSDYQTWRESMGKTNQFLDLAISQAAPMAERMQRATITAEMTQAGLAIIRDGPDALQSRLNPATGKPFVYTQTDDGFELESGYQSTNLPPLHLKFK
jgi:hypothetical protein